MSFSSYMYASRRRFPVVRVMHRDTDVDDPGLYESEELEERHKHAGQAVTHTIS